MDKEGALGTLNQIRHATYRWLTPAGGTVERVAISRPWTSDPDPVERLVRRRSTGVVWTSILTLLVAALVGYLSYTLAHPSPDGVDWGDMWTWVARSSETWDPMATLALIAGLVLPLFLATQVGTAKRSESDVRSARVVSLETITSVACLGGAVLSWLTVPSVTTTADAAPVSVLVALVVPVLFAALFAVSAPSEDSERLARTRSERMKDHIARLERDFAAALGIPEGGVMPAMSQWMRWQPIVRDGATRGAILGVVVAALTWHGLPEFYRDTVVITMLFTAGYVAATAAHSELQVTRMLEGKLSVMIFGLAHFVAALFGLLVVSALYSVGHWRVAMILVVVGLTSVLLARARATSRAFQAIVYTSFRSRARSLTGEKDKKPHPRRRRWPSK